ncbi:hypothetical protein LEP1GSC116_0833, partial [Leptospira interrogans serovar Icterohaemorrhagiae str. Verdun HP]
QKVFVLFHWKAQSILDRIEKLKKADFCGLVSWVDSEIGM